MWGNLKHPNVRAMRVPETNRGGRALYPQIQELNRPKKHKGNMPRRIIIKLLAINDKEKKIFKTAREKRYIKYGRTKILPEFLLL